MRALLLTALALAALLASACPGAEEPARAGAPPTSHTTSGPSTEPSCPSLATCTLACATYQNDDDGCRLCACVDEAPPPVCPELEGCTLECAAFVSDGAGCDTCACAEPPSDCLPLAGCELLCNAFVIDERGCPICACV